MKNRLWRRTCVVYFVSREFSGNDRVQNNTKINTTGKLYKKKQCSSETFRVNRINSSLVDDKHIFYFDYPRIANHTKIFVRLVFLYLPLTK